LHLFFPTVALVSGLFVGFCVGSVPWWVNWLLAAPLYYFLIICSHDALHGCAHQRRLGNAAVGWMGTQMFGLPYPMVRRAHLSHHVRDGAADDIEQFAYKPGPTLPLRLAFGNWMYYLYLPKCGPTEWVLAGATVLGTVAAFLLCPRESLLGWFLPMQTAACYIAITTIWIPHGPCSGWWMDNFPFVTGYHEDHHAQPSYPFHQIARKTIRGYARSPVRRLLAAGRKQQQVVVPTGPEVPPIGNQAELGAAPERAGTSVPRTTAHPFPPDG
jgi:fatty acid desaturase